MEKVGLIGYGNWGKLLYKKINVFADVEFVCRSKDTYLDKLDSVGWVVVATPNDTHYEIVKNCLNAGKNVFCEKPLTPTYKQSLELFKLAEENNVRLYVDDIQNHREIKWDLMENNLVERKKKDQPSRIKTCGSTFKNHDNFKAWKLIKDSGCAGMKIGDAYISEKHCNFFVNKGDAKSQDLEKLIQKVKKKVFDKTGIDLELELQIIGEEL